MLANRDRRARTADEAMRRDPPVETQHEERIQSGEWRRWLVPPALALGTYIPAVLLLIGVLAFTNLAYGFFECSDIPLYHQYATAMDRGFRPFIDFAAEYPPLALRLFALPGHPAQLEAYAGWFVMLMLLALAAASVLVAFAANRAERGWRRTAIVAVTFALSILAIGAIVANRFDSAVALLLACVLWATASRRWVIAGLALGLGTALKLTPLILLPLPVLAANDRRSRATVLVTFLAAAVVPFAAEGAAAWSGLQNVLRYHGMRPLQVESVLAMPLLLAHKAGRIPLGIAHTFGSEGVYAPGAELLARGSAPLAAVLLAAVYGVAWRGRRSLTSEPGGLALIAIAALLAFLVPAKVLSPQFLIWLLPAVALLAPYAPALASFLLGVLVMTHIEYPVRWFEFLALRPTAVFVVAVRNLGLVVAFVWALFLLARRGSPSARNVRSGPASGHAPC